MKASTIRLIRLLCLLAGFTAPAFALAVECPVPRSAVLPAEFTKLGGLGDNGTFNASADKLVGDTEGVLELIGDAQLQHRDTLLLTDRALLDTRTLQITSSTATEIRTPRLAVGAENFDAQIDSETIYVSGASFELPTANQYLRGEAETLNFDENNRLTLTSASLTSCPPDRTLWNLQASSIEIDPDADIGSARNVRFEVGGVPLLYLPWMSWPLSDARKTGFLFPRAVNSDSRGFELSVPWYWNIRPNMDATLTPRFMSRRGLQLRNEFRYLTANSDWELKYDVIDDRIFGDVRSQAELSQTGNPLPNLKTQIQVGDVSDSTYLEDLSTQPQIASIIHIDRRIDLRYRWESLSGMMRVQSFQTLDPDLGDASRPYRRLPQLLLSGPLWAPPGPLTLSLDSELVKLERGESIETVRLDIRPRLKYEYIRQWGFFSAAATVAHTRYWLQNAEEAQATRPKRTLPILSLDGGLKLRRAHPDGSGSTLEPRAFYLFAERQDQDELPVFDSALYDFSFDQLFRENRFSGRDRIGDANQLSLALRSRRTDTTGREIWRYGFGSIFYFDTRSVGLDDEAGQRTRSDLVAEGTYSGFRNWQLRATAQLMPDTGVLARGGLDMRYRRGNSLVNLGHRLERDRFEQSDFSFSHMIRSDVTLLGRWQYSQDDNRNLEQFLGLSWESCCWTVRGGARRYLSGGTTEERDLSLEVVFKGLTGFGNSVGQRFERAILGYEDPY